MSSDAGPSASGASQWDYASDPGEIDDEMNAPYVPEVKEPFMTLYCNGPHDSDSYASPYPSETSYFTEQESMIPLIKEVPYYCPHDPDHFRWERNPRYNHALTQSIEQRKVIRLGPPCPQDVYNALKTDSVYPEPHKAFTLVPVPDGVGYSGYHTSYRAFTDRWADGWHRTSYHLARVHYNRGSTAPGSGVSELSAAPGDDQPHHQVLNLGESTADVIIESPEVTAAKAAAARLPFQVPVHDWTLPTTSPTQAGDSQEQPQTQLYAASYTVPMTAIGAYIAQPASLQERPLPPIPHGRRQASDHSDGDTTKKKNSTGKSRVAGVFSALLGRSSDSSEGERHSRSPHRHGRHQHYRPD